MKKWVVFLLVAMLLLVSACGDPSGSSDTDSHSASNAFDSDSGADRSSWSSEVPTDTDVPTGTSSSVSSESSDVSDTQTSSTDTASTPSSNPTTDPGPDPLELLAGGVEITEPLQGDLAATSVCTLKNLPMGNAVQQFFLLNVEGAVYVFTTQRTNHIVYLSRCLYYPKVKNAVCVDYIKLDGFGHGESLEVRERNGKVYVYIASGANGGNDYQWGTTITRFVYDAGTISESKTLTDLNCATANGSALHTNATPYRVNFALNEARDQLLLYLRCDTNYSLKNVSQYMVSYRLSEVDRLLDAASNTLSMKSCTSAHVAFLGKVTGSKICPNNSYQGMDIADSGTVYLSGGGEGQQPGIMRISLKNDSVVPEELCNVTKIYTARLSMKEQIAISGLPEIETFRCFNGRYYVSFNPGSGLKQNYTEIYVLSPAL